MYFLVTVSEPQKLRKSLFCTFTKLSDYNWRVSIFSSHIFLQDATVVILILPHVNFLSKDVPVHIHITTMIDFCAKEEVDTTAILA